MVDLLSRHGTCTGPDLPPAPTLTSERPLFAVATCEHEEPWWWNGDRWLPGDGKYQPCYRPGVRGWWHHLWGHRIIGPDLFPALFQRDRQRRRGAWRALCRRGRISARLRQADMERDYWKRIVMGQPHGEDWGHTL